MPFEREIKLTGPLPDLEHRRELAGCQLEFVRLERQRNTYFDTVDAALRSRGFTLRLRQLEDGAEYTLKGPSTVRADGLTEREELEVSVEHARGLEALRDPSILEKLETITDVSRLVPLLTLETDRNVYVLEHVGELVLDAVRVLNGQNQTVESFTEVELEIEANTDERLLERVLAELRTLAPLEPSREGKFTRALQVLGLNPPSST